MINELVTKIQSVKKKRGGLDQPGWDNFFQAWVQFPGKELGIVAGISLQGISPRVSPGVQSTLGFPRLVALTQTPGTHCPEIRSQRKSCRDSHRPPTTLPCQGWLSSVHLMRREELRTNLTPEPPHSHSPGSSLVSQDADRQLAAADAGVTLEPPLPQNICLLPDCPMAHGAAAHISWALAWEQNGRVWQE